MNITSAIVNKTLFPVIHQTASDSNAIAVTEHALDPSLTAGTPTTSQSPNREESLITFGSLSRERSIPFRE